MRKSDTNTPRSPQARPGNKNAVGNSGGRGAPVGNSYAQRSGEYSLISLTNLNDDDERAIASAPVDKWQLQDALIRTHAIRALRINKDIQALRTTADVDPASAERIAALEDALSRVTGRLQRAVEVYHRMAHDDERLAMDGKKLALYMQQFVGAIDLEKLLDDDVLLPGDGMRAESARRAGKG